ncbi:MAG: tRNA lysidine(34) synthetase TilS [Firmicutes bacterium]|nr:tRNA lysidine(34) synthetase TilS [Bacillota bacterium]
MDLLKTVSNYIKTEKLLPAGCVVLAAVSGGIDSMVMADILFRLRRELQMDLAIASFDHGLRPDSGSDVAFVRSWAEHRGLPFFSGAKDVAALSDGKNVEDLARRERYAFLRSVAAKVGPCVIATAHHRGDQAETVLLHLLRGSGVTGLAGIHPSRDGVVRPLLCVDRNDIADYAAANGIEYREDSTNSSTKYLRNRIRLELLPALADYNPCISRQLNDTAAICRDEDALLDDLAEISLAELWSVDHYALSGSGFDLLAPALQRRVLRKAYQLLAGDLPELSFKQVEAIRCLKSEQSCNLPRGIKAWRRGDLCFGQEMPPLQVLDTEWPLLIDGAWHDLDGLDWSYCAAAISDFSEKDLKPNKKYAMLLSENRAANAFWRTRRDGDYMRSSGKGRRKVKDLFIDQRLPCHLRNRWPLLVDASGETLWLPGLRMTKLDEAPNNILIKVRFSDKITFNI